MITGSFGHRATLVCAALLVGSAAAGQEKIDLYGVTSTRIGWTDASGPVAGYYVLAIHNTEDLEVYTVGAEREIEIPAEIGDEVIVHVAAFDADGVAGPLSPPSPVIHFNPDETTESDPPPSDPTPDAGPAPAPPTGFGAPFDFTGDGVSDVLLRGVDGALTLWEMNGSGVRAAVALPALSTDWAVVGAGDYDGNGVADLLWEERATGRLIVWLVTDGAADEGAPLDLQALDPAGEWSVGASADFDGDGRDDVLLLSRLFGEVAFLRMDGVQVAETFVLGGYEPDWSVAAADDIDADGVAEIVWHDGARGRLVRWSLSALSLVDAADLTGPIAGLRVVGSGDFDGDGRPDLFAHDPGSGASQVLRLAAGELVETLVLPDRSPAAAPPAVVADYDGDRLGDILFAGEDGSLEIWFSTGAGVEAHPVETGGVGGEGDVVAGDGTDDGALLEKLCNADFDGDGTVTMRDFAIQQRCIANPSPDYCDDADMNSDGLVDEGDWELFKAVFSGSICPSER